MSDSLSSPKSIGEVAVQLLDPSSGRPMKSWTFIERAKISIGRSPDQDVEMSDPYVSRNHASLVYQEGEWRLIALGRNGVVVGNQLITEHAVSGDVSFRLGMEGPTLRFRTTVPPTEIKATICFDTLPIPLFQLDEQKLQDEVGQIADGDYFQGLQQRARQMRRQRNVE